MMKTINDYRRGKDLGDGSFGKVSLCTEKDTNKIFAAKTMWKEVQEKSLIESDNKEVTPTRKQMIMSKKQILNEIRVHSSLHHANVCAFKQSFEDEDCHYLLLEHCQNGTLQELLAKQKNLRFTEQEARQFMKSLVEGVTYLHGKNVIHRDLKPENLFLDKDNTIKIGDFGLSTMLQRREDKRTGRYGTMNFMAPECVIGTEHSFEADIWSMGVIMYVMLFGKRPFDAYDNDVHKNSILDADYYFPSFPSVSEEAKDLVRLMLQPDPKERLSLDEIATHPFVVGPASLVPYPTYETNGRNPQSGSNEFQDTEQLQKKRLLLPPPPGFEHTVPTIIACSPCAVNEIAFYF
eukprot:scaffold41796_cov51-Attheya_sp.AAC.3